MATTQKPLRSLPLALQPQPARSSPSLREASTANRSLLFHHTCIFFPSLPFPRPVLLSPGRPRCGAAEPCGSWDKAPGHKPSTRRPRCLRVRVGREHAGRAPRRASAAAPLPLPRRFSSNGKMKPGKKLPGTKHLSNNKARKLLIKETLLTCLFRWESELQGEGIYLPLLRNAKS